VLETGRPSTTLDDAVLAGVSHVEALKLIAGNVGGTVGNDVYSAISLPAGSQATGYNFAETGSAVTGVVFLDENRDGTQQSGDQGLAGVTITLKDSGNNTVATMATAADGSYLFGGIAAGNYSVVETQPAGYGSSATSPDSVAVVVPVAVDVHPQPDWRAHSHTNGVAKTPRRRASEPVVATRPDIYKPRVVVLMPTDRVVFFPSKPSRLFAPKVLAPGGTMEVVKAISLDPASFLKDIAVQPYHLFMNLAYRIEPNPDCQATASSPTYALSLGADGKVSLATP